MSHKIKILQNVKTTKTNYQFGAVFEWSKELLKWIKENKINHMVFEEKI